MASSPQKTAATTGSRWIRTSTFPALFARFDTLVMGRLTYEVMLAYEGGVNEKGVYGKPTVVFSRTLKPADHPNVRITAEDPRPWSPS